MKKLILVAVVIVFSMNSFASIQMTKMESGESEAESLICQRER